MRPLKPAVGRWEYELQNIKSGIKIMTRNQKTWTRSTKKPVKMSVPDRIMEQVSRAGQLLISDELRAKYVKPIPENSHFNYIVDLFTKWYRTYFYFGARYACPGPNAIKPFFNVNFARMEYVGASRFHLSYKRHTGQWFELYQNLTLDQCIQYIRQEPNLQP